MVRYVQRATIAAVGGWMARSALEPGVPMPLLVGVFGLLLIVAALADAARAAPAPPASSGPR